MTDEPEAFESVRRDEEDDSGGVGVGGSLPRRGVCDIRNVKVKEIRKRNTYRGQRGGERRE